MLCDWLKFKVDIQLFLSYSVYASVIFVIFFAEVKYMISPNGRSYISKVLSKLVRNNALVSFSSVLRSQSRCKTKQLRNALSQCDS